ncbi:HamA C-terminal domain-containing protein [Hallerella porci]|uniref:Uncharacterized protein DUF1837 n=1 Tax=Hallerella porci TaxID=1945871 RepID=A0ABX5LJ26_9BACT|nr:DUF1837 domain-containing protein [Hallerella porci]PWK93493.1 uncharacterized protein DUF1837 [Hallerella porci]
MSVPFEIIINKVPFSTICTVASLSPIDNKSVLGLVNDFEDGKWRYEKFQNYIWDNLQETALSLRERQALYGNPMSLLKKASQKLKLVENAGEEKGGEIAEALLYGVMKDYYGAISAVPKIYYKQNSQDPAKGADSVHVVIESEDSFSLWHGEAKFYNNIEDARLYKIVESVHDICETANIKKENSIITDVRDLDLIEMNESLRTKIKSLLDDDISIDKIKPILHIPIMLLYECPLTETQNEWSPEYVDNVIAFQKDRANSYFKKQINKCKDVSKYSEIKFHLVLFPVPKKEKILEDFRKHAEFLRG